ncbi:phospho-N-acetylmuramoyl-pentapeptide-transferase [Clostridium sp. CAG:793]|nr:phospho-N-acetylmuramoyl-pentapeptide-transferase [Clostridium sp. CAG:793]
MSFQVKILLLSFVASTVISMIVIPILRRLKVGQSEREEGPQSHLSKKGTPTMGGIILIISTLIISAFLYIDYSASEPEIATRLLPMIFVTIGFGLVGFVDDFKKVILHNTDGLSPKAKMAGLLIISIAYVAMLVFAFQNGTDIYIPFIKKSIELPVWIYIPFAVVVILATTNAVNLTDGIDGLATSVTTIILTCLTVISIIWNIKETTIFGCIVVGAGLGFLLFNLHPAHIFMGDTGSLLLGGAIAGISLYLKLPLLLLIIAIIPIIETLSVILQVSYYKKTKKRLFKMSPIHHHFELSGWNENKIVSVFSLITLVASIIGILAL